EGAAAHELGAAARALDLGAPTDAALLALRARARSHAWDTLVAAVLLQRDAGGDLAALLRELAASAEAAVRAERDARAATAQARFTAWLILAMPVAGAVIAELVAPGFAVALIANPLSATLAALALVLALTALVAIARLGVAR
ncbi:MAG: type II secretion system F family protein, partial [Solirubrobacteraceae bacterium]